jgi:hypothetical protein
MAGNLYIPLDVDVVEDRIRLLLPRMVEDRQNGFLTSNVENWTGKRASYFCSPTPVDCYVSRKSLRQAVLTDDQSWATFHVLAPKGQEFFEFNEAVRLTAISARSTQHVARELLKTRVLLTRATVGRQQKPGGFRPLSALVSFLEDELQKVKPRCASTSKTHPPAPVHQPVAASRQQQPVAASRQQERVAASRQQQPALDVVLVVHVHST